MKKILLTFLSFLLILLAMAQPKPKPKQPTQPDMNKQMEEAMKDMSPEEKAEFQKMMKGMMPALTEQNAKTASYPEFTNNKMLIPKKDIARINTISKKVLSKTDISSYAGGLYTKLMTKGKAEEIAIVKKIISQTPKSFDIGNASVLAMLQGYPQAAMALSMKAVQTDPTNLNWQNNMASLLTQYGYPEQAIPILRKLKIELPYNSTVLNNLAYAWLGLGETDSAGTYSGYAIRLNPNHPEALLCNGLIEEIKGDPIKASENYIESMENAVNPFTEQVIKNKDGAGKSDNLDFEKIKQSIPIHEFFPKDWIKIPKLSDNVSGYESDMSIQNGFYKMIENLKSKIEILKDASESEIDELFKKDEDDFAKEMMKESIKGFNMMSKTAVIVNKILILHMAKMEEANVREYAAFIEEINKKGLEITKNNNNDKCPDWDRKNNAFLAYANPLIREFHAKRIEDFRTWLNAFCTWIWYIAGNPKNTVMSMCVGWTEAITEMYSDAVYDQKAIKKSCVNSKGDGVSFFESPQIPDFSCPVLFGIPTSAEWQQLSSASNNFDKNNYTLKSNSANPIPNQTIAFGADHESIAEPGQDPAMKSANGTMSPAFAEPDQSSAAILAQTLNDYKANRNNQFMPDESSPEKGATSVTNNILKVTAEVRNRETETQGQGQWFRDYMKSKIDKQNTGDAGIKESMEGYREIIKKRIEQQKARDAQIEKSMESFREMMRRKLEQQKSDDYKSAIEKGITDKIKQAIKSKLSHQLFSKMIGSSCNKIKNSKDVLADEIRKKADQVHQLAKDGIKDAAEIEKAAEKVIETEQDEAAILVRKEFNKLVEEFMKGPVSKETKERISKLAEALQDYNELREIRKNGLQPSINSGAQAPGTFTPVKGLFQ